MKKIWLWSAVVPALLMAHAEEDLSYKSLSKSKETQHHEEAHSPLHISLLLDASYNHIALDDASQSAHLEIPGFLHGAEAGHDGHSHALLAGEDGLNFNYAELSIGATVEEYFDAVSVFHISKEEFEVEEAYIASPVRPYRFGGKLGKFKSDFGYLNNKHLHDYDFSDMPLIYQTLLGDHGLNEKGVQLQHVFLASHYVMAGAEVLRGENEQSFGTNGFVDIQKVDQPNLWIGYLKTAFDIGGGKLLAGVSGAKGKSHMDHLEDEDAPHAFVGDTTLYGADISYVYHLAADQSFTFHGEYLYRKMDGIQYVPSATDGWAYQAGLQKKQGGFYAELIYRYDAHWHTGVRYSSIVHNDIYLDGKNMHEPEDLYVTSAMLEYHPSISSRIRLQYNHNSALYTDEGMRNNKDEVLLQFSYLLGAHDEHEHEVIQ